MKISTLILLVTLLAPAWNYRLLGAQSNFVVVEEEVPCDCPDENPEHDVMIPESAYEEPPKQIIQHVIEVAPEPVPEPAPIVAVVALTQEQFDKLDLQPRDIEVEHVGSSQDGRR